MKIALLILATAVPALAGNGPKTDTVDKKCETEWDKQDKWADKKNRTKERPGYWSEVCGSRPAPVPPPFVQPPQPPILPPIQPPILPPPPPPTGL